MSISRNKDGNGGVFNSLIRESHWAFPFQLSAPMASDRRSTPAAANT